MPVPRPIDMPAKPKRDYGGLIVVSLYAATAVIVCLLFRFR